jgi:hypothetical protein
VGTVLQHAGVTMKNAVELAVPLGKLAQMLGVWPHISVLWPRSNTDHSQTTPLN